MNVAFVVKERIEQYHVTEPILVEEISEGMNDHKEALYIALNRLAGEGIIENYAKGIYYKPKVTRFGEIGINKRMLIEKKYLGYNGKTFGYITGPQLWNEWGITTQVPNKIWIAQNIRQKKVDHDLNVLVLKAKGSIKFENIRALQFLDIIEQLSLIQDATQEEVVIKLMSIFKEKLTIFERIVIFEEVKKYTKKVKVILGLIVENLSIKDEYFCALVKYLKDDVCSGKKIIIDIEPNVFRNNRTWGNGYATSQK